ncbi:MAG: HAD-IIA family hydrolase [Armatimonadota bacterium]|nr:HAD-IIA family hydrolase [Armatimonadota bacterium]MDR7469297.1 HAD-IIA family hydrolase [Armatimonadota bacterium]MDR7539211.1 HAD-IIA family hydrolase [Armatimonadota bacterium]
MGRPPLRPARLYSGYAFDLDGTIYLGDTLLPGAAETVAALRQAGARVAFLSNNPLRTRSEYADKLTRLGIPTPPDDVINSSLVLVHYLLATAPGASLFVIGEESVKRELRAAGFSLTEDPHRVDYVVASFDRTFDYRKLKIGFDALRAGARFIATNQDAYCPTPDGGLPDCGAVIAALEASSGRQVETVVGKPSPIMGRVLLQRLGTAPADSLLVGDRLETDHALGLAVGMATAVVLTGVTTREAALAAQPRPDYILECVSQVLPASP